MKIEAYEFFRTNSITEQLEYENGR
jgi:hypothetical protein